MYIITANRCFESIEFRAKFWKVLFAFILILTISELSLNDAKIMKKIQTQLSNISFKEYSTSISFVNNKHEELRNIDNSLYRVEDRERFNSNDGLSFNANTTSFCGSTYSRNLHAFLYNLGYSSQHVTITSDFGNTMASDMLFGVKYILNAKVNDEYKGYREKYLDDSTIMLQNPYSLSLGYGAKNINIDQTNENNPFENFNNIVETFSGINEKIYTKHMEKISQSLTNLILEEKIIFRKLNKNKEAYLEYEFESERSENAYLYMIGGNFENVRIYINGNLVEYRPTCNYNKMIPIGNMTKGEKVNVVIEPTSDRFAVSSVYLYYENEEILKKHYEVLSKNEVKLKEVSGRKFEGTFITKEDKEYIVFSIPYDEGFTANVDGKKVNIINVSDGFMGIEVEGKGEHIVKLSFIPEGFVVGAIVSVFGIIMFVIWKKISTRNLLD